MTVVFLIMPVILPCTTMNGGMEGDIRKGLKEAVSLRGLR